MAWLVLIVSSVLEAVWATAMGKRLFWWRILERVTTGPVEESAYEAMIDQLARRQRAEGGDPVLPPAHLFAFVLAMLQAWFIPSPAMGSGSGDHLHALRRRSVREAVERLQAPAGSGQERV